MTSMGKTENEVQKVLRQIHESKHFESPELFHPSECIGEDLNATISKKSFFKKKNFKYLKFINDYHAYCKLCQQHFYSCSNPGDINSYFQTHINSATHMRNKKHGGFSYNKPIFMWEKLWYTGCCLICGMKKIESFVIHTKLNIIEILKFHCKSAKHIEKLRNNDRKPLDQLLATTDLFSNICIKKECQDQRICKLCYLRLYGPEAVVGIHLNSKCHYTNFKRFLKEEFQIQKEKSATIEEIEQIICHVIEKGLTLKIPLKFKGNEIFYDYLSDYDTGHESGDLCPQFEGLTSKDLGFNPNFIKSILSINSRDFCNESVCTLCDVRLLNVDHHVASNSHKMRVIVFERCNSVRPVVNVNYDDNRHKRLSNFKDEIEKYMKFKEFVDEQTKNGVCMSENEILELNSEVEDLNSEEGSERKVTTRKFKKLSLKSETQKENIRNKKGLKKHVENEIHSSDVESEICNKVKSRSLKTNTDISRESSDTEERSNEVFNGERQNCSLEKFLRREISIDVQKKENSAKKYGYCGYCKFDVYPNALKVHNSEKNHRELVERHNMFLSLVKEDKFLSLIKTLLFKDDTFYVCVSCNLTFANTKTLIRHMSKKFHIGKYENLNTNDEFLPPEMCYILDANRKNVLCKTCGLILVKNSDSPSKAVFIKSLNRHFCDKNVANTETADVHYSDAGRLPLVMDNANQLKHSTKRSVEMTAEQSLKRVRKSDEKKNQEENAKEFGQVPKIINKKVEPNSVKKVDKESGVNGKKSMCQQPSLKVEKAIKATPKESLLKKVIKPFVRSQESGFHSFLCHICLVDDALEVVEDHIKSDDHLKNEFFLLGQQIRPLKCEPCKIILLGTEDMFQQHYNSLCHMSNVKHTTGKEELLSPSPRTNTILFVTGLPNVGVKYQKAILALLFENIARIKWMLVNKRGAKITFADSKIAEEIGNIESLMIGNCELKFEIKKIFERSFIMKSAIIYLLGHLEELQGFLSRLEVDASYMHLNVEERKKEEDLCKSLTKCISDIYPNCRCYPFGSRVTGLTTGNSDLDVFVDCDDYYYGTVNQDPKHQARIVTDVARVLRKSRDFDNVTSITKSRVPIVRCSHVATKINCDLSFKNGLGCENTGLIKYMISLDVRVKSVILFLKHWVKSNSLYGRPYFSSYALIMLVFYYLQQGPNPVLPTVDHLKNCYKGPEELIAGWNCNFSRSEEYSVKTNNESVPELILGFFKFYCNFNFDENIVSPLTGKPLKRAEMKSLMETGLPEPYMKYLSKIQPANFIMDRDPICVMDPFDLNHNLTKCFPKFSFQLFVYFCRISASLLSKSLKSESFEHLY